MIITYSTLPNKRKKDIVWDLRFFIDMKSSCVGFSFDKKKARQLRDQLTIWLDDDTPQHHEFSVQLDFLI
jgi:hypothetical protein